MKRFPITIVLMLLSFAALQAQLTFNVNDMLGLRRVADPRLSPDDKVVAFTIGTVDKAANRVVNQIHTIGVDGQNARQITNADSSSSGARWSPDGSRIAYNHAASYGQYDASIARCRVEACRFSRRRPLDSKAAQFCVLARSGA